MTWLLRDVDACSAEFEADFRTLFDAAKSRVGGDVEASAFARERWRGCDARLVQAAADVAQLQRLFELCMSELPHADVSARACARARGGSSCAAHACAQPAEGGSKQPPAKRARFD